MWLLGHVALGVCGDIGDTAASSLATWTASAVAIAIGVLGKCGQCAKSVFVIQGPS